MQLAARPIERGSRSKAIGDHGGFVEDWDLNNNMRKVIVAHSGFGERPAWRAAVCVIKNTDADQNEKADADKQKTAHGGNETGVAQDVEQAGEVQ